MKEILRQMTDFSINVCLPDFKTYRVKYKALKKMTTTFNNNKSEVFH